MSFSTNIVEAYQLSLTQQLWQECRWLKMIKESVLRIINGHDGTGNLFIHSLTKILKKHISAHEQTIIDIVKSELSNLQVNIMVGNTTNTADYVQVSLDGKHIYFQSAWVAEAQESLEEASKHSQAKVHLTVGTFKGIHAICQCLFPALLAKFHQAPINLGYLVEEYLTSGYGIFMTHDTLWHPKLLVAARRISKSDSNGQPAERFAKYSITNEEEFISNLTQFPEPGLHYEHFKVVVGQRI